MYSEFFLKILQENLAPNPCVIQKNNQGWATRFGKICRICWITGVQFGRVFNSDVMLDRHMSSVELSMEPHKMSANGCVMLDRHMS